MFTLLIVDDEPTIRRGLSQFIPWDSLDVELIGEASDGAAALMLVREKRPDLVITDIRMPNMDGLELAQILSTEAPATKVIILTGYADFSYAQTALRYGVADFVLKPTSRDKVTAAVKGAQERILAERKTQSALKESALEGDLSILREQFLGQLTRGLVEQEGLEQRLLTFDIRLGSYYLAAFQFSECETERRKRNSISLKNMVAVLNNNGYTYFFGDHMVFALFRANEEPEKPRRNCGPPEDVLRCCLEIADTVNNFSETRVCAAVSQLHQGVEELPTAGEEAIFALSRQFFTGEEFSIFTSSSNPPQNGEGRLPIDQAAFLCGIEAMLGSYDFEGVQVGVKSYLAQQNARVANAQDTINTCMQLYFICVRVLSANGREVPDASLQNQIAQGTSMLVLKEMVLRMLEETEALLRHGNQKSSPSVSAAVEYIAAHYDQSLHLREIADYVHLNPQHLCRIFKKELGETINEYITRIRIEEAKRLLREEHKLAYEVAEQVGFKDPAYFSLIFKKITGVSPKNFR